MSVKAMSWVWTNSRAIGNSRLVLLAIADRCNDEGSDAWPSLETLQKKTLLSESTVRRCIQNLAEIKELEIGVRSGRTNIYRIRYESRSEPQAEPARKVTAKNKRFHPDTPSILTPLQDARGFTDGPGGVSTGERGGVAALTPDTSSTTGTSIKAVPTSGTPGERRSPDGERVRAFVAWWCDRFRAVRKCSYRVLAKRDIPAVRQLLDIYGDETLRAMCEALLVEAADPFIVKSERGIGVLSVKATWLADKCAQAARRAEPAEVQGCPHSPRCQSRLLCQNKIARPERYVGAGA